MRRGAAVARRYAKALWALARAESRLEPVGQELQVFARVLADEARLRDAVLLPWVKAATKRAIVTTVAERLGRRLGKTVLLDTEVDPGLLGGFVAEVGSRVLDMSVAGQLAALRERIIKGVGGAA